MSPQDCSLACPPEDSWIRLTSILEHLPVSPHGRTSDEAHVPQTGNLVQWTYYQYLPVRIGFWTSLLDRIALKEDWGVDLP